MKYMLLTYLDEQKWADLGEAEQKRLMDSCGPHVQSLVASGKMLGGAPLQPTAMSTTVRKRGGKELVTDGPFAETREQLGGYTLIEADDLDDAIKIVAGFFAAETDSLSTIEIRPIVHIEGLPTH